MGLEIASIKRRIRGIQSIQKTTQAMLIITVARLPRAQQAANNASRYKDFSLQFMGSSGLDYPIVKGAKKKNLVFVISSNRGYCGGFNENLFRYLQEFIAEESSKKRQSDFVVAGRKGISYFNRKNIPHIAKDPDIFDKLTFAGAKKYAKQAERLYLSGEVDKVVIISNLFKSMAIQIPMMTKVLPIKLGPSAKDQAARKKENPYVYLEPNKMALGMALFRNYIEAAFFDALAESVLGATSASVMILKQATDNCRDYIKDLTLALNKSRQAAITQELSEIVSTFTTLSAEGGM